MARVIGCSIAGRLTKSNGPPSRISYGDYHKVHSGSKEPQIDELRAIPGKTFPVEGSFFKQCTRAI